MTVRSITLILLVTSVFGIACESNSATQPVLDPAVLTTLQVVPSTLTLNLGDEGVGAQLGIVARDQRGVRMYSGRATFSSSDSTIARVRGSGTVTPFSAGTAEITVTYTVADISRSAVVEATIREQF